MNDYSFDISKYQPWGEGSFAANVTIKMTDSTDFMSFSTGVILLRDLLDKAVERDSTIDTSKMHWGYVTGAPVQDIWLQTIKKEDESI